MEQVAQFFVVLFILMLASYKAGDAFMQRDFRWFGMFFALAILALLMEAVIWIAVVKQEGFL